MKKQLKKYPNYTISENGYIYDSNNKRLKTFINPCGYPSVIIDNNIHTIAYLVANTFIENPDNNILVGYYDDNIANVKSDNLFWYYSGTDESKYSNSLLKVKSHYNKYERKRPLEMYVIDKQGNIIEEFENVGQASKHYNVSRLTIRNVLFNKYKLKGTDYYLILKEEYDEDNIEDILSQYVDKVGKNNVKQMKYYLIDKDKRLIKSFKNSKEVSDYFGKGNRYGYRMVSGTASTMELFNGMKLVNQFEMDLINEWQSAKNQRVIN